MRHEDKKELKRVIKHNRGVSRRNRRNRTMRELKKQEVDNIEGSFRSWVKKHSGSDF